MTRPDEDLAPEDRPGHPDSESLELEAPAADVAEQSVLANPAEEPPEPRRGLEAGEWDALEQSIVVDLDDEYDH